MQINIGDDVEVTIDTDEVIQGATEIKAVFSRFRDEPDLGEIELTKVGGDIIESDIQQVKINISKAITAGMKGVYFLHLTATDGFNQTATIKTAYSVFEAV